MSGRKRKLGTLPEQVRNWVRHATHGERRSFFLAVGALGGDRGPRLMRPYHPRPVLGSDHWALQLPDGLLLVWRDPPESPYLFEIVYVGRIPGFD